MNGVRKLLQHHGLLPDAKQDALKFQGVNPWDARAKATQKLLTAKELAIALGHIARHRGFKSNAKSQGENDVEGSKMKKAMAQTQEKFAGRTFGETIATDPTFADRKRNKESDFSRTPQRADLAAEVRAIFSTQRRLGSKFATRELEAEYLDETRENAPFHQRGLQDSEKLLANCAFETKEKRTSKRGYSFELFRFLSRLNTFEIREGRDRRRVTAEELAIATSNFGSTKKISYTTLRNLWKLSDAASFASVRFEDEKLDAVARSGNAAEGAGTLHTLLKGAAWDSLVKTPEKLDRIAEVISFRSDLTNIRSGLNEIGLEPVVIEALMDATNGNTFIKFTGAGNVSSLACRNMIPHLAQTLVYSDAAKKCNYDHTDSRERHAFDVGIHGKEALKKILSGERINRHSVGSPTARKALIEAVKQVKAIVEVHGIPDAIHIELARDIGKGIDERREIENGIERRNKEKDKLRLEFADKVGQPCTSANELMRFELWKQQNGKCVYSDEYISPSQVVATDNSVQVDHILPWSRFGDDSFNNKTLCTAKANQEKRGRTPFEWFSKDKSETDWEALEARVKALPALKGYKRRNYTIRDAASVEGKFLTRNLNDTRWACRLLAECLKQLYPKDKRDRKVFTRPGALTDRLRRGWGVQWMKKDEKTGQRIPDDRHHALDAVITAATTEGMMQVLTRAFQKQEAIGSPRDFSALDQPWPGFRDEVMKKVEGVFVSRAERHRARGKAHDATIRSISEVNGEAKVFERKQVSNLTEKDLENVKDPERNAAVIDSLHNWILLGKPGDKPPLSPKGDPISKVALLSKRKPEVFVRKGAVDRGDMARVDVFRKQKPNGKWNHYLVPVYPHQIATDQLPPKKAMLAHKDEHEWPSLDSSYEYIFPIEPMAYIEMVKSDGEVIAGYFRDVNRNDAGMRVSYHQNNLEFSSKVGSKTLNSIKKFSVDRLGRLNEIKSEERTWRGKVCISPNPQG